MRDATALAGVRALVFDTFGTVVDWRGSILDELAAFGRERRLTVDWAAFLDAWKRCYRPGMDKVNSGDWPWTNVDVIYRRALDGLLAEHGVTGLAEPEIDHLNRVWTRLRPWPDSVPGLVRLKTRFIISPLSNGNFSWLVEMAKRSGLPWDCVLTAENAKRYKPAPEVYRMAIELLGPRPEQVMLVAAHNYDLAAARSHGMRTAFVPRLTEYGPGQTTDLTAEGDWDVVAADLSDLARQLRC